MRPSPKVFLVQAASYHPEIECAMPLGIMYLAAYLQMKLDCRVRLYDMQLGVRNTDPVIAAAREFEPDLIGIGGMTPDAKVIDELARRFKAAFPGIMVLAGGVHATNYTKDVLANEAIDYVIAGEGELAFAAFIEFMLGHRPLKEVPNLVYRNGDGLQFQAVLPWIEDLDALPFPAFDLIELERYHRIPRCGIIYARRRYAALATSRGCPFQCIYCHKILGKQWRPRSAENVVEEMERLVRDFRIGEFVIMDDMFNWSAERVNQIAHLIIDRGLQIKLSFPIGLRGDIMTDENIRLLKQAGMFRCMYAVETASPRLQRLIRKNNNLEKLRQVIDYTRRQGVMVHGTFMLGFPTETEAEARGTVEWALSTNLHTAAFFRVIPYEGSELMRLARESGAMVPEEKSVYEFHKANVVNISTMSNATLNRLRRAAYRRFYISPLRFFGILRALPNRWRLLPLLLANWVRKAIVW